MTSFSAEAAYLKSTISNRCEKIFKRHDKLATLVDTEIQQWHANTRRFVDMQNPYHNLKEKALSTSVLSPSQKEFNSLLAEFMSACAKHNKLPSTFWSREKEKIETLFAKDKNTEKAVSELAASFQLLRMEYQKLADSLYSRWELEKIRYMRDEFLKALLEKIASIEKLIEYIETLGLEPGVLLDLSTGAKNQTQIDEVLRWLEYLKNDEGVQRLLDLMGKISQVQQSDKLDKIIHSKYETTIIPDISSKEEIIGLTLGNQIEHALPSELALLSDSETSLLFDLKYIESALLCFEMEGITEISKEVQQEAEVKSQEDDDKGPLIICVDTSGSMQGAPETIAKAVTLIMATKARQCHRSCYLINFSTGISTINLSKDFSMDALLSFLQVSFWGGTDVAPAIRHGLDMMKSDEYANADMLVISDFIMGDLPETIINQMKAHRDNGTKFNSLVIDDVFMDNRMRSLFDHEWVYNPTTSNITEIIEFQRNV